MSDAAHILTELAEVRALVADLHAGMIAAGRPILTSVEAAKLANVGAGSAFSRWAQTWGVKACGKGRYARRAVMAGLEREARSASPRRRTPEAVPRGDAQDGRMAA
jgi:hypothetical protein